MISTIKHQLTLTSDQVAELIQIEMNKEREALYFAVLGQFSVGKSSLLNALLSRPKLLPTKLTETTAIVTEICVASQDYATIHLHDGISKEISVDEIGTYIHGNDELRNVEKMSVHLQDTKLANRVTLIDTPGSNVIHAEHQKMTRQAIASAEYAIYVIASTALSHQDIAKLKQIIKYQPNLVIVINHMDRLLNSDEGESLFDIIDRVESDLMEHLGIRPDIFPVSAKTMMGIEELREYLFVQMVEKYDSLKRDSTNSRLYHLLTDVKIELTKALELLLIQEEEGLLGLQQEKDKLLAQQNQIEAILNREQNDVINKWDDIRSQKENKISLMESIWKDRVKNEKESIHTLEDVELFLGKITNELDRDKKAFIDDTIHELKEQAKSDFDVLSAEIGSVDVKSKLAVAQPDYSKIELKQQEEMAVYMSQIARLRAEYKSVQEQYQNEGNNEIYLQQMVDIQNQLSQINDGLNIPYEPIYIEKQNVNAGFFAEIGKNIGRTADWASTLIPVFGATKLGQNIAKQGLKTALKEAGKGALKQTAKEMAEIAAKKIVNPEEFSKFMPKKNPALELLEMVDLEGWGKKIGTSFDDLAGNNTPVMVEDENQRMLYLQRKNQLEFEMMNKMRDMKKLRDQARTKEDELKFLQQMELKKNQLIQENEQKLQEFEREMTSKRAKFESEHWKEQFQKLADMFIDDVISSLEGWLKIQRNYIMNSSRKGLHAHYDEEFTRITSQIEDLQKRGEAENQEIGTRKEEVISQLGQCETLLAEVSDEKRIIMA